MRLTAAGIVETEAHIQTQVAAYLDLCGVLYCHVPNGGARHKAVAADLKAQGVKRGVPDILIFDPPRTAESTADCQSGIALELKAPAGRVSDSQAYWLEQLNARGWRTMVCIGTEAALAFLKSQGFTPTNAWK